jgi:hypothetical protein
MILKDDKVTAKDLSYVLITKNETGIKNTNTLSKSDLEYQENRRKRKVRKLESTLRLVRYIELSIRYEIVKVQMWFIKRKLEKELGIPPRDWSDFNGRN